MLERITKHVTYANIVSTLALVVALGTGTAYAANTIGSSDIIDGAVKTADLANGAVTSAKIRDANVGAADLATGAVTSSKIRDANVGAVDLAANAVSSPTILDGTITAADIADGGVTGTDIATGAVTGSKIATGAVTSSKITTGAVGGAQVLDNSLTASDIGSSAVGTSEVTDNSLTFADIVGGGANGSVSVPAGMVPSGRCAAFNVAIAGGSAGEAVVFSVRAPMQDGVFFYGTQVIDATTARTQLCNLSGTTQLAISNMPVRILTFR